MAPKRAERTGAPRLEPGLHLFLAVRFAGTLELGPAPVEFPQRGLAVKLIEDADRIGDDRLRLDLALPREPSQNRIGVGID